MGQNHSAQIHHFYGHFRRNIKAGSPSTPSIGLSLADDGQLRDRIRQASPF